MSDEKILLDCVRYHNKEAKSERDTVIDMFGEKWKSQCRYYARKHERFAEAIRRMMIKKANQERNK